MEAILALFAIATPWMQLDAVFDDEGRCVDFVEDFMQLPERVKGQYA